MKVYWTCTILILLIGIIANFTDTKFYGPSGVKYNIQNREYSGKMIIVVGLIMITIPMFMIINSKEKKQN
jgi:hypothetical protein